MMRLIGDKVLVALQPKQHVQDDVTGYSYKPGDVTASGLILATRADSYDPEASTRGIVMQLGEKRGLVDLDDVRSEVHTYFVECREAGSLEMSTRDADDDVDRILMKMAPAPFDVQVGDVVIFSSSAGSAFEHDGIRYVILTEEDISGVLEPVKSEAMA